MSELPPPPVSAEVDLQDFPFMPLHVARLRDSDLAAEEHPEACWYAVLLWAASWHQIPAGSLPDNDNVLTRLVGLGRDVRTWKKHKAGALRGFVLCDDNRLYHPVVAEQAIEAWNLKLRQRHRTFCAAVRKHNERNPDKTLQSPSFNEWNEGGRPERIASHVTQMSRVTPPKIECDIGSKGQGQGQGHIYIEEPKGSFVLDGSADDDERDPEKGGGDGGGDAPLTPSEVARSWNNLAYELGLPLVEKLTPDRVTKVRARLKSYPELRHWQQAFNTIRQSPFLRGDGAKGWRADFDFLIQAKSFNRLVEGSYVHGN